MRSFDLALALAPGNADTFNVRGNAHYAMQSYADALADYDRAAMLRDDAAPILNNRGNALRELGRHDEALAGFDRALALKPDYAEAHNNRGNALLDLNRTTRRWPITSARSRSSRLRRSRWSIAAARCTISAAIDDAIASFDARHRAQPAARRGALEQGAAVCSRSAISRTAGRPTNGAGERATELTPRDFAQPQWRGEDLHGKTILLHAEQGFGDTIQFIRYLPLVGAKGAQGGAGNARQPDAADRPHRRRRRPCMRRGEPLPAFDVHCPLMSLPLAFGTTLDTIPAPGALSARAGRTRWSSGARGLARRKAPRVGLVWSGKPSAQERPQPQHRRCRCLRRCCRTPGVTFVSLQRSTARPTAPALAAAPLIAPRRRAHRFRRHRGGDRRARSGDRGRYRGRASRRRLGKPLWLLLPAHSATGAGCWTARTAPGIRRARLFRQPRIGDWDSALIRRCRREACRIRQALATRQITARSIFRPIALPCGDTMAIATQTSRARARRHASI